MPQDYTGGASSVIHWFGPPINVPVATVLTHTPSFHHFTTLLSLFNDHEMTWHDTSSIICNQYDTNMPRIPRSGKFRICVVAFIYLKDNNRPDFCLQEHCLLIDCTLCIVVILIFSQDKIGRLEFICLSNTRVSLYGVVGLLPSFSLLQKRIHKIRMW